MAVERLPAMVVRKYQERKVRMEGSSEILNWREISIELKSQIQIGTGMALRPKECAEKSVLSAKQQTRYRGAEI